MNPGSKSPLCRERCALRANGILLSFVETSSKGAAFDTLRSSACSTYVQSIEGDVLSTEKIGGERVMRLGNGVNP